MNTIGRLKLRIIYYCLYLLENKENTAAKETLKALIADYGKMYHLQIKTLKSAKKPLIRTLILFTAGSDITIKEPATDMQTLLNELNHSI